MKEEVHVERTAPRVAPARVRRASWGAIFAGVFVTLVMQIMFTLLGTAIGAATINPMTEQNPTRGLGLGSGIWLLVTGLISVWVGSCVAGRLSGGPRRADGMIHGVVTWSVATFTTLMLLVTATGAALGGAGSLLGNALNTQGGQGAMASVQNQAKQALPQAGAVLSPTGRSDNQQQAYAQASQQARQVGQQAAEGVAKSALWGFIALVLGLMVAAWGGWAGTASLPRTNEVVTPATARAT